MRSRIQILGAALVVASACHDGPTGASRRPADDTFRSATAPATATNAPLTAVAASILPVTDVEQLYAAVNNPANEGAAITLAPGTYVLSAKNSAGADRPNAGRLELQRDMSLYGVTG